MKFGAVRGAGGRVVEAEDRKLRGVVEAGKNSVSLG